MFLIRPVSKSLVNTLQKKLGAEVIKGSTSTLFKELNGPHRTSMPAGRPPAALRGFSSDSKSGKIEVLTVAETPASLKCRELKARLDGDRSYIPTIEDLNFIRFQAMKVRDTPMFGRESRLASCNDDPSLLPKVGRELFYDFAREVEGARWAKVKVSQVKETELADVQEAPNVRRTELRLKAGETVLFRPIAGNDVKKMKEFIAGLDDVSYALRFPAAEKGSAYREKLAFHFIESGIWNGGVAVVENHEKNLVALADVGEVNVEGVRRVFRQAGQREAVKPERTCEVSFVVADKYQKQGLGSQLLNEAIHTAKEMGFRQMTALVAPQNENMLKVFEKAGIVAAHAMTDRGNTMLLIDLGKIERR